MNETKKTKLETTLQLNTKLEVVYLYLKNRFHDEDYQKVSRELKGYLPDVKLVEDNGGSSLSFYVKGREALTEWKVGGWNWGYELTPTDYGTDVKIWYDWSSAMVLASMGTVKLQAANEVVETVLALKALEAR